MDQETPLAATAVKESATVAFIDLAGFSAIADVYGDSTAIAMLEVFEGMVGRALEGYAPPIKWIGDEVMLAFPEPRSAIRALGNLLPACRNDPRLPLTRTALHHGPVIRRANDLFGSTVNIASRVAALAAPGQLLATKPVADAAAAEGILVGDRGETSLRSRPTKCTFTRYTLLRPRTRPGLTRCARCMHHMPPFSGRLPVDRGFAQSVARRHTIALLRPTHSQPEAPHPGCADPRNV